MKEYKVGDTIYVKDTVNNIDEHDPIGTYRGKYTGWFANRTIIDELPVAEPVKPVLPKNVAEEMESAKDDCGNFFSYLADSNKYPATLSYTFPLNGADDDRIKILAKAWYNGYTVEQEPRYKVYVAGTNKQYMYVKRGELAKAHNKKATPITPQSIGNYITAGVSHRDLYWFTDEEITKFDLQDCEKELVADD